jgi:hypothetical protein
MAQNVHMNSAGALLENAESGRPTWAVSGEIIRYDRNDIAMSTCRQASYIGM